MALWAELTLEGVRARGGDPFRASVLASDVSDRCRVLYLDVALLHFSKVERKKNPTNLKFLLCFFGGLPWLFQEQQATKSILLSFTI